MYTTPHGHKQAKLNLLHRINSTMRQHAEGLISLPEAINHLLEYLTSDSVQAILTLDNALIDIEIAREKAIADLFPQPEDEVSK